MTDPREWLLNRIGANASKDSEVRLLMRCQTPGATPAFVVERSYEREGETVSEKLMVTIATFKGTVPEQY